MCEYMHSDLIALALVLAIVVIIIFARSREGVASGCDECAGAPADAGMRAFADEELPLCPDRYMGISPFLPPNRQCYTGTYNPFWSPASTGYIFPTETHVDVPISRMVGDHVPLE